MSLDPEKLSHIMPFQQAMTVRVYLLLLYCFDKTLWPKVTYTRKLPFRLMIQKDNILPWQEELQRLVDMTAGTKSCEIILSSVNTEQKANRKQGDDMNSQQNLQ